MALRRPGTARRARVVRDDRRVEHGADPAARRSCRRACAGVVRAWRRRSLRQPRARGQGAAPDRAGRGRSLRPEGRQQRLSGRRPAGSVEDRRQALDERAEGGAGRGVGSRAAARRAARGAGDIARTRKRSGPRGRAPPRQRVPRRSVRCSSVRQLGARRAAGPGGAGGSRRRLRPARARRVHALPGARGRRRGVRPPGRDRLLGACRAERCVSGRARHDRAAGLPAAREATAGRVPLSPRVAGAGGRPRAHRTRRTPGGRSRLVAHPPSRGRATLRRCGGRGRGDDRPAARPGARRPASGAHRIRAGGVLPEPPPARERDGSPRLGGDRRLVCAVGRVRPRRSAAPAELRARRRRLAVRPASAGERNSHRPEPAVARPA